MGFEKRSSKSHELKGIHILHLHQPLEAPLFSTVYRTRTTTFSHRASTKIAGRMVLRRRAEVQ
jgi:hypothetical protein